MKMTGKRVLVVCALVLLGTLVVPSASDQQLSGDPRTGEDGPGNQVLDVLSDALRGAVRPAKLKLQDDINRLGQLNDDMNATNTSQEADSIATSTDVIGAGITSLTIALESAQDVLTTKLEATNTRYNALLAKLEDLGIEVNQSLALTCSSLDSVQTKLGGLEARIDNQHQSARAHATSLEGQLQSARTAEQSHQQAVTSSLASVQSRLRDATTALSTRANNMNTQLSEAGHRLDELNEATAGCPDGFTECGEYCYRAVKTVSTYKEAEQICGDMGAVLATPRSAAENKCARDVAAAAGGSNFWIGYRGGNTADSFVGADGGGAMTFTNWDTSTYPRLALADNCVFLNAGNGLWYDTGCQITWYVLCQMHN